MNMQNVIETIANEIVFPEMDDHEYILGQICKALGLTDEMIASIRNDPTTFRHEILERYSQSW
jgi:hypothetical protein